MILNGLIKITVPLVGHGVNDSVVIALCRIARTTME